MANKQVRYSHRQIGLKPNGTAGTVNTLFGIQDVGISTNFNLQQYFEFGQIELYDQLEDQADVQITISKIFDGKPFIWHEATRGETAGPSLVNRSNGRAIMNMSVFADTNDSAVGSPGNIVECSGLYPSSLSYGLTVDGAFTESMTLVGNDILWRGDGRVVDTTATTRQGNLSYDGDNEFANNNDAPSGNGIEIRGNLTYAFDPADGLDTNGQIADPDATILPRDIFGITSSGTNEQDAQGNYGAHVSSITMSTELGRDPFNELGRLLPYHRQAQFPTEVTCAIECFNISGANISATDEGIFNTGATCSTASNLQNQTIRVATCGGARFYLGTKNKLSSVDEAGGGVDGSPSTITYNYTNFNALTVMHENDPNASGTEWWNNRAFYLVDTE